MSKHFRTWENYHKFALERGGLVATILEQFTSLKGKRVLDYGCGDGGTARMLAKSGAAVTAVDVKPELKHSFADSGIRFCLERERECYLKSRGYDIIVLQDVLEHVPDPAQLMGEMTFCLHPDGLIYISTPNRIFPRPIAGLCSMR